jgi:putative ABC transport system permease protein
LIAWWLLPFSTYRMIVPGLKLDYSVFVVGGLMVVLGSTWVIVYNAEALSSFATKLFGRVRSLAPVLRTSLAYPARNRFRTGMTIALFTLVVFTLVVGASTSTSFNHAFSDETLFGGGYQVRAEVAPGGGIPDMNAAIAKAPGLRSQDFRVVASQSFVPVQVRQGGPNAPSYADYPLRGLDDTFLRSTSYGLAARAHGYTSDAAVWKAMQAHEGLAVVDALVAPHRDAWDVGVLPDFKLRGFVLEDQTFAPISLDVRDPRTGNLSKLTVIGVLKETAPYTMAGISTSERTLAPFGDRAQPTAFYFQLAPGVDAGRTAKHLESAFLSSGMQAESTHDTMQKIVAGSQTMNRIILGFLGLGLVIGVAALGVVSARSVVERRQQIGVLRAIGFQRRMVQLSFLLESSVIALGAIVLGTVFGVAIAYNVIQDSAANPSWSQLSLSLPWATFAIVFVAVYAAALLATFIPARRASRIAPASALRYQ